MSKWDKLLTKIYALSKDLRFDELRKVLESYGYKMNTPKGGSSHYTFRKAGCQPITIPKHEPIKKVYVEMVKQIVESFPKDEKIIFGPDRNLGNYINSITGRNMLLWGNRGVSILPGNAPPRETGDA